MKPVKYCDGAGGMIECPHPHECMLDCHFNNAVVTRTIKPYPTVPDDIEEATEQWYSIGQMLIGSILAAIVVFSILLIFTGIYIGGLLL